MARKYNLQTSTLSKHVETYPAPRALVHSCAVGSMGRKPGMALDFHLLASKGDCFFKSH